MLRRARLSSLLRCVTHAVCCGGSVKEFACVCVHDVRCRRVLQVWKEEDKFKRLLQLLGVWYEEGSILVFVDTQQKCDSLYGELTKAGYPCLSLHGGKEQFDRDQTIADFKNGMRSLLVATSVAGWRAAACKHLWMVLASYVCARACRTGPRREGPAAGCEL